MLWNVWDRAARATELLAELGSPGSVPDPAALRGRIPTSD